MVVYLNQCQRAQVAARPRPPPPPRTPPHQPPRPVMFRRCRRCGGRRLCLLCAFLQPPACAPSGTGLGQTGPGGFRRFINDLMERSHGSPGRWAAQGFLLSPTSKSKLLFFKSNPRHAHLSCSMKCPPCVRLDYFRWACDASLCLQEFS